MPPSSYLRILSGFAHQLLPVVIIIRLVIAPARTVIANSKDCFTI